MIKRFYFLLFLALVFFSSCDKEKEILVSGVTLDKNNITISIGTADILTATVHPHNATNKVVSWKSSNTIVATVDDGIIIAKEAGEVLITVITDDGRYTAECTVTVTTDPEWVEINGVKWAKRNVDMPGTFVANPEDVGMFYQWNRKIGWSSTDPMINSDGGTSWDSSIPEGNSWEKTNDPCPMGWRVPTIEEIQSLSDADSIYAYGHWSTEGHGIAYISGNKTMFFPDARYRRHSDGALSGSHFGGTMCGNYWSSTAGSCDSSAYYLWRRGLDIRSAGYLIRCVSE